MKRFEVDKPREQTQADPARLAEQFDLLHRALTRTIRTGGSHFRARATATGITPQQQLVLQQLIREDGLSVKTLSQRMALSHSTVSGIVGRLAAKQMVYRETDSNDRRINRIYLSEKVNRYVKRAWGQIYEPLIDSINAAAPEQQAMIASGLACLCELLENQEKED